jgi:hypothetical protein
MPAKNRFRHQLYLSRDPISPYHLLRPEHPPPFDTDEHRQRMRAVGECLRGADVRAIYLVHGSFVGTDALGLLSELARVWPAASELIRRVQKQTLDSLAGDMGNYNQAYADALSHGINDQAVGNPIPVRLFYWSGENNHIGRSQGALELIQALAARPEECHGRILLWGHSHGGNVFALLTNLLGADEEDSRRFFQAARAHYQWPLVGYCDVPLWLQVRQTLAASDCRLRNTALDLVTFGTPPRYGWDSGGYARLLHFIHHRPAEGLPPWRAVFPPTVDDVLTARHGDYVQQWGIAGTNFAPGVLAWRSLLSDWHLNQMLQTDIRHVDLLARLRLGLRLHDEGVNLLVDYGLPTNHIGHHLAGHAIYTRREWLLFHAEEVARRFYQFGKGKP